MVSRAQNEKEEKQWFEQGIQERGTQESNMKLWNYRETLLQQREDNTTISPVLTYWEFLTKHQTITFFMNSSDKLPRLPSDIISSQQWV
jgi:hypothetical protein